MQRKKQAWAERIKKRNRAGFSLVELIVIVAMMAVLIAVLAPSLLGYVERSRAQKDVSAMDEVVSAVFLAMADPYVYDELAQASIKENVSCYIDNKDELEHSGSYVQTKEAIGSNKAQYMFGDDTRQQDEVKFYAAGSMRGTTLTFIPNMSSNESKYLFGEVIVNKFFPDEAESINNLPKLYNAIRSVIGDTIELSSQTYRNSEYTIFVKIGTTGGGQANAQDAMQAYGQFSGTNLSLENREYYIADNRQVYEPEIGTEGNKENVEVNRLTTPVVAINGTVINITAVENATEYKIFNGETLLMTTSATSIDLATLVTEVGTHTIKVQAVGGTGYTASDYATVQYTVSAPEVVYQDFTITADNRHMIGYTDETTNLVIPATFEYDGVWYRVVGIGDEAFKMCRNLIGVTLPEGIVSIGSKAFYVCSNLTGTLVIPSSVTSIGEMAFAGCAVTNIEVDDANTSYCDIDGMLLDKACTVLIDCPEGKTGNVVIPGTVTTIAEHAFSNCVGLTGTLIIPDSVVTIDRKAFFGCENLTGNLVIPDSVESIGNNAFYNCAGFTGKLTIGESVVQIGAHAFYECSGFISVEFANTNGWCVASRYESNINLTASDLQNQTTALTYLTSTYVEYDWEYTEQSEIVYQDFTITADNRHMIGYTDATTNLVIPETFEYDGTWYRVVGIGESAFGECLNLTGITIPNSVTTIGDCAFYCCTNLTGRLVLPDNLTTIGYGAFWACDFTGNLVIPEGVTTIGDGAFVRCGGFSGDLIIPDSVTELGRMAFAECTGFTSLTIGDGVTTMDDRVFAECSNLSSITMSANVTYIYIDVFPTPASGYWYSITTGEAFEPSAIPTETADTYVSVNPGIGGGSEELVAGFYDAGGNLLVTWNDLVTEYGMDIEMSYTADNYNTATSSPSYIINLINNNPELAWVSKVVLDIGVTEIGDYAFYRSFLECVVFNDGLELIGDYAFASCLINNLEIPNSVTSIGNYAFSSIGTLTSNVVLPNGLVTIGAYAFYSCSALQVVIIPDSVTIIGDGAFSNTGLRGTLTLPSRLEVIGNYAFDGCSNLTGNLLLPESVSTIGSYAFRYCDGFTGNLVIPDSVTSIGRNAFSGCSGFSGIEFANPDGWWYASSATATSGTALAASDLQDPTTALTYLTSTYRGKYWFRTV